MTANRLVVVFEHDSPDNEALEFFNYTEVANRYGVTSHEAGIAKTFFEKNPTGTLSFIREGLGQRPHVIGSNISSESMVTIRGIDGPLTINFNGRTYGSTLDLSSAKNLHDVQALLEAELNSNLQVLATTTGSTITPKTVSFRGYFDQAQLTVTSVGRGAIQIGGVIAGKGVTHSLLSAQIIYQHSGSVSGGVGEYSCLGDIGSVSKSEPMNETYGILDLGTVTSGTVASGEEVTGRGIPKDTAILADLGDNRWLVNNAVDISAGERLTMLETPLSVGFKQDIGATENNDFFEISPNGAFGYDANPSTLSFASGTAADLLGLGEHSPRDPSTGIGALDASPGGQHPSIDTFMNDIVTNYTNQFGLPVQFNQLQTNDYKLTPELSDWAHENGIKFIPHPPVS
jgi:Protein of unknown function (DUF3383)